MMDVNVQIIHSQNGEDYNLYPASKDYNIIISESPLVTLDEFLKDQMERNTEYDAAVKKLEGIEDKAEKNVPAFSSIRVNEEKVHSTEIRDTVIFEIGDWLSYEVEDKTIRLNAKLQDADVSDETHGLMTPELFKKLNKIEDEANKYIHPESGVSPGTYLKVTVDDKGHVTSASDDQMSIAEGGTGARSLEDAKKNLEIPELTLEHISETATAPVASKELYQLFAGKADKEHGNHVPDSVTPNDQRFLREGNQWSEIWKGTETNAGILMLTDNRDSNEEFTAFSPKGAHQLYEDAKSFTIQKITELIGGAGESYDTLVELQHYIEDHKDVMDGLIQILDTKVTKEEGKGLSSIDFDQTLLNKLQASYTFSQQYANIDQPEYNTIVEIQKNGVTIVPDENRVVNIPVPTKVSDIENDTGYITKHPGINTQENTETESSPPMGGSFTMIDSVVRDSNNHVVGYNVKTVKLPDTATTTKPIKVQVGDTDVLSFDGSAEKLIKLLAGENMTITVGADGSITFTPSYKEASDGESGLMPKEMFTKLTGIATGANKYTLPTAGKDQLGGVKTTSNVTDVRYHTPSPIVNGIPYYKKSCIDVLTSDPVNPPLGYCWVVE